MNSVRINNLRLKYQRFAPSDCKDIGIRRFEFVAKTQFLCLAYNTPQQPMSVQPFGRLYAIYIYIRMFCFLYRHYKISLAYMHGPVNENYLKYRTNFRQQILQIHNTFYGLLGRYTSLRSISSKLRKLAGKTKYRL